ncbi:MAG TPA: TauD/TfdA family dioxygenase [Acetobacteraceae bacterium]|nr:TauD/TfdA family dioxygenase [Acetobacteraceae bacterium]
MSDNTRLELRPLGSVIGADVAGVNLAALDTADFAAIERVWHEHLVLRFRDQHLSDAELMDFSHRFGELDRVPIRAAGVLASDDPRVAVAPEARDYVNIISNVRVDGEPIGGLGNYEAHWHTDMSYNDVPPMASVLYGIEVPPEGGNTSFANMYAAYETPDAATKQRIAGLVCIHDASRNSVGELRRGFVEVSDPSQTVGARHPIVRTHPVTRRKSCSSRRRSAHVVGLAVADSEALLDLLWAHATQPAFCWTQVWREGDVVIWDNRCVLHRRNDLNDGYRCIAPRSVATGRFDATPVMNKAVAGGDPAKQSL